jgi:hypothetical protein
VQRVITHSFLSPLYYLKVCICGCTDGLTLVAYAPNGLKVQLDGCFQLENYHDEKHVRCKIPKKVIDSQYLFAVEAAAVAL